MKKIKAFLRRLSQRLPIKARCGHWVRKSETKSLYYRAGRGWWLFARRAMSGSTRGINEEKDRES